MRRHITLAVPVGSALGLASEYAPAGQPAESERRIESEGGEFSVSQISPVLFDLAVTLG
jgi:hypothetical protein